MNYLSVDIGGSSMKYALMDDTAVIMEKGKRPLNHVKTSDGMLAEIHSLYNDFDRPEGGIAVSYCGELNAQNGLLFNGGSYPFMAGHNLKEELSRLCETEVSVENDGNCAAIAELQKGNLVDCTNGVVLIIGTGLAGALILDGKLYRGSNHYAGLLSFMTTEINTPFSLDNMAAKSVSSNYLSTAYVQETASVKEMDGIQFFELVNKSDSVAMNILERYCTNVANVAFNIQLLLDVEKLCVGGGISVQPLFRKKLKEAYEKIYVTTPLQYINPPKAELVFCAEYNDANLVGAMYHHKNGGII
ncbi:MAG: ROK family protein [Solobacterium sp.]|nr:ROK family protein [Solobacterium sp.]